MTTRPTLTAPLIGEQLAKVLRAGVVRRDKTSEFGTANHSRPQPAERKPGVDQGASAEPMRPRTPAEAPTEPGTPRGWKGLRAEVHGEFRRLGRVYAECPAEEVPPMMRELARLLGVLERDVLALEHRAFGMRDHELGEDLASLGAWVSEMRRRVAQKGER